MSKPKQKHYVVWKGRKTGVFSSWAEAEAQVKGFTGAEFKSFESLAEAHRAYAGRYEDYKAKPAAAQGRLMGAPPAVVPSWTVDAACGGNPGLLEYRCVDTATGEELFHRGPFPQGTNNVGEFLAIVEALMRAKREGVTWPIYSDSVNALNWVATKKARTNLAQTEANAELFERMARAEAWLRENPYPNRLLKWQTDSWGENPADFGRK
ncbi:MAG: viroplasmin family protein [Meiothermus sp.]|nr:viroplasmin family protein [Meiothermus sp.]